MIGQGDPPETHYAVLGLDPRASREQVEKAYRFCLDMYREDAIATYSLVGAEEVGVIRGRIAMAYEVLSDPGRRREYDIGLGIASAAAPLLPFPSQPASRPAADEAGPVDAPAAPAPPAAPVLPDQVTGQELRRIRESRGISLREIAQISKIGVRFFEYIEDDRVALLPAPVYLRGFLMEYGRALGLDPRRTADAYMANLPPRKA